MLSNCQRPSLKNLVGRRTGNGADKQKRKCKNSFNITCPNWLLTWPFAVISSSRLAFSVTTSQNPSNCESRGRPHYLKICTCHFGNFVIRFTNSVYITKLQWKYQVKESSDKTQMNHLTKIHLVKIVADRFLKSRRGPSTLVISHPSH